MDWHLAFTLNKFFDDLLNTPNKWTKLPRGFCLLPEVKVFKVRKNKTSGSPHVTIKGTRKMQKNEQFAKQAICLFYKINIEDDFQMSWNFGKTTKCMVSFTEKKIVDPNCVFKGFLVLFIFKLCLFITGCKQCTKIFSKL